MSLKKTACLLFLMLCFSANAQEFAMGIRGGINQYSIGDINSRGGSIAAGQPDELFSPNKEIGYQFGIYLTVILNKFYFQPEVNYLSARNTYDFPLQTANWRTSKFEVPILIGYEVFDPVSIYVGPIISFFGDTELDGVQVTGFSDGGPDLEKNSFNFMIGAQFKWKRFGVDLRYEIGMTDAEEELLDIVNSSYGVNLADHLPYKPNVLSLSFTVDIFRTDSLNVGGLFSNLFQGNKCYCPY